MKNLYGIALYVGLLAANSVLAADVAKLDIYVAGIRQHSLAFTGLNSSFQISNPAVPGTTLELKLIAPEPLIVEVKEVLAGTAKATGRIKLLAPGDSVPITEIKGTAFHSPYVLVRPEQAIGTGTPVGHMAMA